VNTGRTGSSETIYFKLADLRLHKRDVRFGLDSEVAMIAVSPLNPAWPVLCRHPAEPVKLGDPGLHTDYDLPSVVAIK
jgi:hypothetical protein